MNIAGTGALYTKPASVLCAPFGAYKPFGAAAPKVPLAGNLPKTVRKDYTSASRDGFIGRRCPELLKVYPRCGE